MAQYFNCGYARVAAYDIAKNLSKQPNWIQLRSCNENELVTHFQKRFQHRKEFAITNATYFATFAPYSLYFTDDGIHHQRETNTMPIFPKNPGKS